MEHSVVKSVGLPTGMPTGMPNDSCVRPADVLRKRALGVGAAPLPTAIASPSAGGLGTLGEEDESPSPRASASSSVPAGVFATPKPRTTRAPGKWQAYWDKKIEVHLPSRGGTFNVYLAGSEGPAVMCVHGGGYTGLTWSLVAKRLKDKYQVVAPDMRGHGLTTTDNDTDFSKQTMSEDIIAIWDHLYSSGQAGGGGGDASAPATAATSSNPCPPADPPAPGTAPAPSTAPVPGGDNASPGPAAASAAAPAPAPAASSTSSAACPPAGILVGHSMGGGLAVWAAATKRIKRLEGVVVIDVVEGTALAALPHMMTILAGRPASFNSLDDAVLWAVRSGMSRNKEAAAVSIPSQLVQQDQKQAADGPAATAGGPPPAPGGGGGGRWVWRTPLQLSRPYWEGWYSGLSEAFLQLSSPKALVLAGTDRLDRSLTIGQMQGRFQLILMPTAGHAIHEDEPDRAAEHLLAFLRRFRVGEPPLQFPKAPFGTRPVLPVVAGPVIAPPVAGAGAEPPATPGAPPR